MTEQVAVEDRILTLEHVRTLVNALSEPRFDVSKRIITYWNKVYDMDEDVVSNVLPLGPLIHRENKPDEIEDLYIRKCYKELYERHVDGKKFKHMFFTGTSGVGKSVFRSYIVWKQVQYAKHNAQSCIILMSKSPKSHGVPTLLLVIIDGVMSFMKKFSGDEISLTLDNILEEVEDDVPIYHHVDVSEGDSSTSIGVMKRNFYYASPNEKAWKEKIKISGVLYYLPTWHLDELVEFYLTLGWRNNPTLTNRLLVEKGSQNRGTEQQVSRLVVVPTPSGEGEVQFTVDESEYTVPRSDFITVIKTEADTYGYIPRNLFLKEPVFTVYCVLIHIAAQDSTNTIDQISQGVTFRDDIRHKLVSINPVVSDAPPENNVDYCRYSTSWSGTFVTTALINNLLFKHSEQLEKNFFGSKMMSILTENPKLNECLALGLFALNPAFFKAIPIVQSINNGKEKITHPTIDTKSIDKFVASKDGISPQIRMMNNEQFRKFVLNVEQVGMACPINSQYPAIDGVMHFLWNGGVRTTAFMQVTTCDLHETDDEAADSLKSLIDGILEQHPDHQIVFFWMNFGTKHPDIKLNSKLKQDIPHFHIKKATENRTESQQQHRSSKRSRSTKG